MEGVVDGAEHCVRHAFNCPHVEASSPETYLDVIVGGRLVPRPVVVVDVDEDRVVGFVSELPEEHHWQCASGVGVEVRVPACESEVGEVLGEGFEEFNGVRCPNKCHPSCLRIASARICPTTSLVAMTAFSRYFASPS